MGLVTSSNEASFVGTMTSGGTDVIEMSASTSRSTAGTAVDVVVGDSVSSEVGIVEEDVVVGTVVGASVAATVVAVETGSPDEGGAVALEAHEAVRSTRATRPRLRSRKCCNLTALVVQRRAPHYTPHKTRH